MANLFFSTCTASLLPVVDDSDSEEASTTASGLSSDSDEEEALTPLSLMASAVHALIKPVQPRQLPIERQTVFFLDWDDTLLCTSFLSARQDAGLSAALASQLVAIGATVAKLLQLAQKLGKVFIVTNAEDGWVQASAELYLPGVLPALEHVAVRSARALFEEQHPNNIPKWKERAFLEVARKMDPQIFANVISIGDSAFEMTAARNLGYKFAEALVKTIKFQARPTPGDLQSQLEIVVRELARIERAPSALDIEL